jgi:hypothetical protein
MWGSHLIYCCAAAAAAHSVGGVTSFCDASQLRWHPPAPARARAQHDICVFVAARRLGADNQGHRGIVNEAAGRSTTGTTTTTAVGHRHAEAKDDDNGRGTRTATIWHETVVHVFTTAAGAPHASGGEEIADTGAAAAAAASHACRGESTSGTTSADGGEAIIRAARAAAAISDDDDDDDAQSLADGVARPAATGPSAAVTVPVAAERQGGRPASASPSATLRAVPGRLARWRGGGGGQRGRRLSGRRLSGRRSREGGRRAGLERARVGHGGAAASGGECGGPSRQQQRWRRSQAVADG